MRKFIYILLFLILAAGGSAVLLMYGRIWRNNINLPAGESIVLYIPTGSDFNDVYDRLRECAARQVQDPLRNEQ
jgi:hypothetical protein